MARRQKKSRSLKDKGQQDSASQQSTPIDAGTDRQGEQSLAQKRAKHALAQVNDLAGNSSDKGERVGKNYGNYLPYVKALPANIIISGLGQALAMELSGKKKGHDILYEHMNDWLCNGWGKGSPYQESDDILTAITESSEADYLRAQSEAMEYLEWLKKFATAFLPKSESGT